MIKAEDLFYTYTGTAPYVLNGINLEISDGEYVSIVGENGCGKSTLVRIIMKFLRPTRGSVICDAKRIGYVPQRAGYTGAGFPITVYEALDSYRKLLKIKDKSVVTEKLRQVGMEDYASSLMGNLSGGQMQKIFIARALMGAPELLILDEPSTGVDINSQRQIYGFVRNINRERGITVISVEHNLDAAVENSTLVYHLVNGHGHLCSPQQYAREFLNGGNEDA